MIFQAGKQKVQQARKEKVQVILRSWSQYKHKKYKRWTKISTQVIGNYSALYCACSIFPWKTSVANTILILRPRIQKIW